MTDDLNTTIASLQNHPRWIWPLDMDDEFDLTDPAWLGHVATRIIEAGGLVDPQFRPDVMARDLLTLWAAQADMATLVESRREAIRSGQIDPTEAVTCRLAGLDWIG